MPSATSAIVIHGYKLSKKITDPAEVGRIVRWFDVLPIEPPHVRVACSLTLAAQVTLSFRNTRGSWLAQAGVPRTPASVCQPIGFTIAERLQAAGLLQIQR
ncbi:MAG TPA: hypothetical protein VGK69_01895 [Gaiellaceae bacterium]